MAWVKVPPEHHPLFRDALPKDPKIQTLQMFGGVAAKLNGHMFGGLFGRSIIVRLSDADRAEALAIDGTAPFDPMGNGRVSKDTLMMAESVMEEPAEMKRWLAKAAAHAATLPAKADKKPPPESSAPKAVAPAPAAKAVAKPPASKPAKPAPPTKKAATKAAKKLATKAATMPAKKPAKKPAKRAATKPARK